MGTLPTQPPSFDKSWYLPGCGDTTRTNFTGACCGPVHAKNSSIKALCGRGVKAFMGLPALYSVLMEGLCPGKAHFKSPVAWQDARQWAVEEADQSPCHYG